MKKIILGCALIISMSVFSQKTISEGTIIKVSINNDISGKEVEVGQKLDFTTTEDLIQGNTIVLKKGLKVVGTVTEAAKSKGLGKKGKLSFNIDYLYLENGKVIKLRSEIKKNLNGSGGLVVASAVLLSPLALFVHGKNAKYEKGEVFDAYVDETMILE